MLHPLDMVCTLPKNGPTKVLFILHRLIYGNTFKRINHCPECFLYWHGAFLGQGSRFRFVQMKSVGSQMAPLPERGQKGDIL